MNAYRIVAHCDPYNARKHYNHEPVIRYDGATPIEWVIEDGFSTEKEAVDALMRFAKSGREYESGSWNWYDDAEVEELKRQLAEDFGEDASDVDIDWYEGEGIYCNYGAGNGPLLLVGQKSFSDDSMSYWVDDYEV